MKRGIGFRLRGSARGFPEGTFAPRLVRSFVFWTSLEAAAIKELDQWVTPGTQPRQSQNLNIWKFESSTKRPLLLWPLGAYPTLPSRARIRAYEPFYLDLDLQTS